LYVFAVFLPAGSKRMKELDGGLLCQSSRWRHFFLLPLSEHSAVMRLGVLKINYAQH
jgi:hypothetical protein